MFPPKREETSRRGLRYSPNKDAKFLSAKARQITRFGVDCLLSFLLFGRKHGRGGGYPPRTSQNKILLHTDHTGFRCNQYNNLRRLQQECVWYTWDDIRHDVYRCIRFRGLKSPDGFPLW